MYFDRFKKFIGFFLFFYLINDEQDVSGFACTTYLRMRYCTLCERYSKQDAYGFACTTY